MTSNRPEKENGVKHMRKQEEDLFDSFDRRGLLFVFLWGKAFFYKRKRNEESKACDVIFDTVVTISNFYQRREP